jgi:orotate phosphoribosyltransferase
MELTGRLLAIAAGQTGRPREEVLKHRRLWAGQGYTLPPLPDECDHPHPGLCLALGRHIQGGLLDCWNQRSEYRQRWCAAAGVDQAELERLFPPAVPATTHRPPLDQSQLASLVRGALGTEEPPACRYRLEVLETAKCVVCPHDQTDYPVHRCSLHGTCVTTRKQVATADRRFPRSCQRCKDAAPAVPVADDWAVGMTVAPRPVSTLKQSVASTMSAGWQPLLFAEPGSDLSGRGNCQVVQRSQRLGCFHNWLAMLTELLQRFPQARRILTLQDDVAFTRDVRAFLEREPWPHETCGMLSLYTAGHYQNGKPPYSTIRVTRRPFWGALATVFPRKVAEAIVADPQSRQWLGAREKNYTLGSPKIANSDTFIGRWLDSHGYTIWAYDPGLSQHIAETSSLNNGGRGKKGGGWRRSNRLSVSPLNDFKPTVPLPAARQSPAVRTTLSAKHIDKTAPKSADLPPSPKLFDFDTYADLAADCKNWARQLRGKISAVCGIPRSGVLPAAILAQELHIPLVSMDTLAANGRDWRPDRSRTLTQDDSLPILVVDDSTTTGRTITEVRQKLGKRHNLLYGAVYCTERARRRIKVDCYGVHIQIEHAFEWIVLRDFYCKAYAVDLDGVISSDWSGNELQDPQRYLAHLEQAPPLTVPKRKLHAIVTGRLEQWRRQTEQWLRRHKVDYEQLIMFPGDFEARRQYPMGVWKGQVFQRLPEARMFIESCPQQAEQIHQTSGKPVLCYPTMKFYN